MKTILKIGKKLPKPIKKPLSWIYNKWNNKWNLKIDKDMVRDLAEYFNLDQKEILWLLQPGERLNADFWHILNPKTEKEIEEFYSINPFYIFELLFWHMKGYQRRFRSEIIKLAEGEILDFGGGIGDLSIELAKKGGNCDYADIYGKTFEFAKWLFQKKGCDIKMIDLSKDKLLKEYDTILCIDVIEHVTNPKIVLKDLANHLKINGRLIITNLNVLEVSEAHPMHFKIDFDAEKYLNLLGLFKTKEPWLWIKSQRIK
jgi:2-polyprenyl-3-methyl-5-hydroxy-6-metoxy-1,4-benzoquinol methylase